MHDDLKFLFLPNRFSVFKESPITDLNLVFNFKTWPLDRETLCVFGQKNLDTVLDYFEPLFVQKKESIHVEYQDLKAYMSFYKTMPIYDAYIALIQTRVPSLNKRPMGHIAHLRKQFKS